MICETPAGTTFEVPEAWLAEVGADLLRRTAHCYRHGDSPDGLEVRVVDLREVRPPVWDRAVRGLVDYRAASILRGFSAGSRIEPVRVVDLPDGDFRYRVRDGFHRYHLSIAWGFTHVPVAVDPWGEDWM